MKYLLFLGIALAAIQTSLSVPDFCSLPSDEGEGTEFIILLYYDGKDDLCYPFMYKGQGGNANRFELEKECIRNCSNNAEQIYPMDEVEACHLKKAIGSRCGSQLVRYYYDSYNDKCKKFVWSGCNGNGNRFRTIESCNATCDGVHDEGHGEDDDEPDTPYAIIFWVLLALVLAAIIAGAAVLIVKSQKKGTMKKKGKGKSKEPKADAPLQGGGQGIEMA